MKVVYIFRDPICGGHSIEELFKNITNELTSKIEVVFWYYQKNKSLWQNIKSLRKMKADVFHITGDVHYMALFLPKTKTVLTIHDLNYYQHKLKGLKKILYYFIWIYFPVRHLKYVTVISNFSRDQLKQSISLRNKSIYTIPNCYPSHFNYSKKEFNSQKPVLLHIGTTFNKNLPRLIEAIRDINCKLNIVGELSTELKLLLKGIDYNSYVNVDFKTIQELYIQADIVCFVSLAEGFGLPIIEAQAIGRPVITSAISPMKEIAGSAAYLVNPHETKDIQNAIKKIISDSEFREKLIEDGLINVSRFSIKSVADEYLEVYKTILN